jgi:hypothetical protein
MTNSLRDALDDLVAAVPDHVVRDDLPAAAWTAGRRRRFRRRVVSGAVAAAAVVLAAVVVVPMVQDVRSLTPASEERGEGVTAYPQRIGHQWWIRDLPDSPGPAAGLILIKPGGFAKPSERHVVSPGGDRWRLMPYSEDIHPTISPNGRYVGYFASEAGPYVIHDLVNGERIDFPEVGTCSMSSPRPLKPYCLFAQAPSFWSPDGRNVLVSGTDRHDIGEWNWSVLVLGLDGSITNVKPNMPEAFAAGWASDSELVFVGNHDADPDQPVSPAQEITATITDLAGSMVRSLTFRPDAPWEIDFGSQWDAIVSTSGKEIAVGRGRVQQFDLSDGRPIGIPVGTPRPYPNPASWHACGLGWTNDAPTVPLWDEESSNSTTAVAHGGGLRPLVVVEPGVDSACFLWASDALSGEPRSGIFRLSTAWWTWWWREIVAALLLVGVPLAGWLRRRAYRSTSRYTSTASALPLT